MKWQAVLYFFSFGSLVASIVAGVFTPFCRNRSTEQKTTRRPAQTPVCKTPLRTEQERISGAMRYWSTVRADADLAYTPPRPQPAEEPQPEPETQQAVLVRDTEARRLRP